MNNNLIQGKAVLTAGVIIIKDKKVLLVRNTSNSQHKTDSLGIPAGRVEPHEDTLDTAIRETMEEIGVKLDPQKLHRLPHIYYAQIMRKDGPKVYAQVVYYTNECNEEPKPGDKAEPVWVSLSELDNITINGNIKDSIFDVLNEKNKMKRQI